MLLSYFFGNRQAFCEVESTTLEMSAMTGDVMFRGYEDMDGLEQKALAVCSGTVLDVGAGSGCHSLYLQQQGLQVDSLDISPGCIEVMRRRKIQRPIHCNLFSLVKGKYSTVLMLMNGLGICGTIGGLNRLLRHVKTLLAPGGQLIADSTDLSSLFAGIKEHLSSSNYYGETRFVMKYGEIVSEPFPWLYVDFDTLAMFARYNGLECEQIHTAEDGRYLVRIVQDL
jgi:SAM-dependent methyltransferase